MIQPEEDPVVGPAAVAPQQPAATPAAQRRSVMEQLFSGGADAGTFRDAIHRFGAGMGNLGNSGGDPFVSFGQGFGGASASAQAEDAAAAATARADEKLAYDRSHDEAKTQREIEKDRADMAIKTMAEKRAERTAGYANQKTALEIRRLSRQTGLSMDLLLKIDKAAVDYVGDDMIDRDEKINAKRDELIEQAKQAEGLGGLSSDASNTGLSQGGAGRIMMNPETGEKVQQQEDGSWVPL